MLEALHQIVGKSVGSALGWGIDSGSPLDELRLRNPVS